VIGLLAQALRRGGALLHQRRVLLRHLVQLTHGLVHL